MDLFRAAQRCGVCSATVVQTEENEERRMVV